MSLTAFLPTGAPQVLPFIGTPGAATVGHALLWSESPQGFTLAPISVGPDQFSGVLPVASGGTGSNNGSITGTGALTFEAGGTNQNINLNPSGTGSVGIQNNAVITLTSGQSNLSKGFSVLKSTGFFSATNGTSAPDWFIPYFVGKASGIDAPGLTFHGIYPNDSQNCPGGAISFSSANSQNNGPINGNFFSFVFVNWISTLLTISGNGDSQFFSTTESTSTTTGAVRVDGGLGVAKNVNIGSNLKVSGSAINFANLPTSNAGLAAGDLWLDGEIVKVKL